ncbi:MAG: hypothetical protein N3A72_05795 [bacterium]|nr:hypothetical protein [bacterium]
MDFAGGSITRSAHDIIQPGQADTGWNDMEISFYARTSSLAVQFVSIMAAASSAGAALYWDDIEVFAAPPSVDDAELTYGNTKVAVNNGSFDSNTSGWIYQIYGDGTGTGTITWAASQSGRSGVLSISQVAGEKIKISQYGTGMAQEFTPGKSVKLSAYVLTNAAAGQGGKYYLYGYSQLAGYTSTKKSFAAIIQPGAIGSSTWEEIKVGGIPVTPYSTLQVVAITPTGKAAQTHYVDDITVAMDKDPIYFWDSALFP